jgi:hydroxyisourate hydrolase
MLMMSPPELRAALLSCLAVERWATEVAAAAPFASADALLEVAGRVAGTLSAAEVDEALAGHPRIGEKATGDSQSAQFSRGEQASVDADDEALGAALAAGNVAYEERFDRVFLIRAAGRTRAEILAELTRRIQLSDEAESLIVASELAEITMLRLAKLLETAAGVVSRERSHITTHVLDAVTGSPAAGVAVVLEQLLFDSWRQIAAAVTDADGRVAHFGPVALPVGRYRVSFDTEGYFEGQGRPTFYPEVVVSFTLADADSHYHVPLLLSPFAYSTYRGS